MKQNLNRNPPSNMSTHKEMVRQCRLSILKEIEEELEGVNHAQERKDLLQKIVDKIGRDFEQNIDPQIPLVERYTKVTSLIVELVTVMEAGILALEVEANRHRNTKIILKKTLFDLINK